MSRSEACSIRWLACAITLVAIGTGTGCVETSIREGRQPMDYEAAEAPPANRPSAG